MPELAELDGEGLVAELWRAHDAWERAQRAGIARTDVVPEVAPVAPVVTIAWENLAPLPEPDAADVEAYEVTDKFCGIGELVGGDPDRLRDARGRRRAAPGPAVTDPAPPDRPPRTCA